MKPTKILIGSSVRAAAMSALRLGEVPWCIDLFADRDLVRIARTLRCPIRDYPHALPAMLSLAPNVPWDYTGGLENHPEIVAAMMAIRPLSGNPPTVLGSVRDPFWLAEVAREFGFLTPAISAHPDGIRGEAVRKPFRGSGGRGISSSPDAHPDYYFQQKIEGRPISAVYRNGEYAGWSHQSVGDPRLNAPEYAWCGATAFRTGADDATERAIRPFLDRLVEVSGLRGDFGFDLIGDGTERKWYLLEVNPRYTASMEVVEVARIEGGCCKRVLFADREIVFPEDGPWMRTLARPFDPEEMPTFADIPHPGETIEPGWPILSVLAVGNVDLDRSIDGVRRVLGMA